MLIDTTAIANALSVEFTTQKSVGFECVSTLPNHLHYRWGMTKAGSRVSS